MYIVYIRERHCFSLVCTSRKAIKKSNIKVDVQMGPYGLEKLGNRCVNFIQSTFSYFFVTW